MGDAAIAAFNEFRSKGESERRHLLEALEAELLPQLRQLHGLEDAAVAAEGPF
jgi:hypothetical protein